MANLAYADPVAGRCRLSSSPSTVADVYVLAHGGPACPAPSSCPPSSCLCSRFILFPPAVLRRVWSGGLVRVHSAFTRVHGQYLGAVGVVLGSQRLCTAGWRQREGPRRRVRVPSRYSPSGQVAVAPARAASATYLVLGQRRSSLAGSLPACSLPHYTTRPAAVDRMNRALLAAQRAKWRRACKCLQVHRWQRLAKRLQLFVSLLALRRVSEW